MTSIAGPERSIENAPLNRFILWTAAYTFGGMFTDGYVFGSTAVGMGLAGEDLQLTPAWMGALTAAVLAGIFIGSPIAGRLADRYGRQRVFLFDMVLFALAAVAHLWAQDPAVLLILRLLVGVAIGGEYAVGSSLLAEFAPRKPRSVLLATLTVCWSVGYVVAYFVSEGLKSAGWSWQEVLAAAAVPAFLTLVSRLGAPESPRWLISKGHTDKARAVVRKHYGPEYGIEDLVPEKETKVPYAALFRSRYRKRTAFASLFWTFQVTVSFAMLLFLPTVLGALSIGSELGANLMINGVILVGAFLGIYLVRKCGRRPLVIWSFVIMAVFMGAMVAYQILPVWVTLLAFAVYMLVSAASGNLQFVYPPEMFPTDVRASAVGFAAAFSRIGSTVSTFLLPIIMASAGIEWTFIILAGVSAAGALISLLWAPETRDLTLYEASVGTRVKKPERAVNTVP